jgi:hypothetical protein
VALQTPAAALFFGRLSLWERQLVAAFNRTMEKHALWAVFESGRMLFPKAPCGRKKHAAKSCVYWVFNASPV